MTCCKATACSGAETVSAPQSPAAGGEQGKEDGTRGAKEAINIELLPAGPRWDFHTSLLGALQKLQRGSFHTNAMYLLPCTGNLGSMPQSPRDRSPAPTSP